MSTGALTTLIRDVLTFLLGIWGIVYQQLTGNTDTALLLVYMACLGLPGALAVLSQIRGIGKDVTSGTHGSSSPSVPSQSG